MLESQKITLPDVSDDENATLNALLAQLYAKTPRNVLRASYYDGKRALRQVGSVIPPQYYRLGLVLGWSAKGVDYLARRCNLDRFVWTDGELDDLGYREVWEGNHLDSEVSQGLVSSLIHGTAFLVNTRGDADETTGLIHVKDALNATGEWNPRRRRLDNLLSVTEWEEHNGQPSPRALTLYRDSLTITAERDSSGWTVDRSAHPWGVPAEPLVYRPRTGRPFGSSRISRAVMSLHDQALRAVIRLEGHMDVYSFPEFWLLGADESIFKNPDGTQKASWALMLGRFKGIPDDDDADNPRADVKHFPAASPEPHLAALNAFAKMMARELALPDSAVAITDMANPTSAEAYTASREDLIAEAEGATDDWSLPLRRSLMRALAMQNGLSEVPAEWASIDAKWRSPLYLSRAAQADAGMKQLTAVPWLADTEVGLELLGLDEQQVRRAMADRRRTEGRRTIETLAAAAGRATDADAQ